MDKIKKEFKFEIGKIINFCVSNIKVIILGLFFIIGILIGTLIIKQNIGQTFEDTSYLINGFINKRAADSAIGIFINSFLASFPLILISFLIGLCAIGMPFIPLIPAFRGLGIGLAMGYLYSGFGVKGIAYCALLIIPAAVFSSTCLILSCRESLKFSFLLLSTITPSGKSGQLSNYFKKYSFKQFGYVLILLLSSFIETLLYTAFAGMFIF